MSGHTVSHNIPQFTLYRMSKTEKVSTVLVVRNNTHVTKYKKAAVAANKTEYWKTAVNSLS